MWRKIYALFLIDTPNNEESENVETNFSHI